MRKLRLLIMLLYASLCNMGAYAQQSLVLSIEQMFALADENSKAMHAEYSALEEAAEAVQVAMNGRLPDIDLSLSVSYLGNGYLSERDFSDGMSVEIPHFGNNFAITATQLLYGGGRVDNSIAIARLKHKMANLNLESVRSGVRFMLVGFYLDLFKLRNVLHVYDKSIELATVVIEDTKARNAAGLALLNDITRQELHLKNLELARRRVINNIDILNYDIVSLLGLSPGTQIMADTTLLDHPIDVGSLEYWQEIARSEGFANRYSKISVSLGEYGEKMERANLLPSVFLTASNHLDGPITIEVPVINKNFNYWYAGVGISYPIHSLYKAWSGIRRARCAMQQSLHRREEALQQTDLDVMADYTRLLEAFDAVETLEKSVQLANENYNVIETRYSNDIALVTDMLDASAQRLDAELQLVNARINVIFNYYKLKKTSGNL